MYHFTAAGSCHARQKFHQSLREVGISIGDLWPTRGALVEDASQCCPPLEHFWPDIAALPIDAVRNATAGALIIGQRPRANVPAASAISEQASIVRERGGVGVGVGVGARGGKTRMGLEKEQVEAGVGSILCR